MIRAERHARSEERLGYSNGYRPRTLTTQVGDIDLLIPKLRAGSFLPLILEPRLQPGPIKSLKLRPGVDLPGHASTSSAAGASRCG